jgi:hypothetical protein
MGVQAQSVVEVAESDAGNGRLRVRPKPSTAVLTRVPRLALVGSGSHQVA